MRKIITAALILLVCFGGIVAADNAEAKSNLVSYANALAQKYGLKMIPGTAGKVYSINEGQFVEIKRTLQGGVKYYILGTGDRYAKNVGVALFDENSNLIDKDMSSGRDGIVSVQPRWTGTFYIQVYLHQGSSGYASVGYLIMYDPRTAK